MYIVIWEISSSMNVVRTGKAWKKFNSLEDAANFAALNLEKTNRESGFFNITKIEVLEIK